MKKCAMKHYRNTKKCLQCVNKLNSMKKQIFFLLPLFFLISACGKLVSDSHPDFVGTWTATDLSNNYILVIEEDNTAGFYRLNLNGDTVTTNLGTARINSNDKLIIGSIKLSISEYPSFNTQTGKWVCRVENWPFTKQ